MDFIKIKNRRDMEKLKFTIIMEDTDDGGLKIETYPERKIASGWLKQDFETIKKFDIKNSGAMKFADLISDFICNEFKKAGLIK